MAPTRGEMSFQSIVGELPSNDSAGSRSGNIVLAGAPLASFAAVCLSQRTPAFTVRRPLLKVSPKNALVFSPTKLTTRARYARANLSSGALM